MHYRGPLLAGGAEGDASEGPFSFKLGSASDAHRAWRVASRTPMQPRVWGCRCARHEMGWELRGCPPATHCAPAQRSAPWCAQGAGADADDMRPEGATHRELCCRRDTLACPLPHCPPLRKRTPCASRHTTLCAGAAGAARKMTCEVELLDINGLCPRDSPCPSPSVAGGDRPLTTLVTRQASATWQRSTRSTRRWPRGAPHALAAAGYCARVGGRR